MLEVGKDVCLHGFKGCASNVTGRRGRLQLLYVLFCIMFCAFTVRTLSLCLLGTDGARRLRGTNEWAVTRADIVDRNGDILAKNIMSGHIELRPNKVKDVDEVANVIHQALPYEYSVSSALKLINSGKRFKYLKNYASDNQCNIVKQAKLAGLDVTDVQKRKYPKRRLFSHIVGFVGNEGHGLEGAERIYDDYLSNNTDPLQLSVDSRIQAVFYEQLSLAMQQYHALSAMGILMNSRTGEIIAMVSLPDFDPENLQSDPVGNRFFKPLRGLFEMGSIFKIFNTAMAFENGITKEYYVAKPYGVTDKFGRVIKQIKDVSSFKPPRPYLSVEEIMLHSCNAGSAQIALDLPAGTQADFFHRLHFDEALDLDFGRTERGLIPMQWGQLERATVSFGHGISVTPMHLLLAVNAMTNGGIYIYPTLQKRGVGVVHGERVISADISARLRNIMVRIAEETTARKARIAGITIGGKTGTAEKRDKQGKPDPKRNITVFTGIFPAEAPQYTIMVMLDEPKGTKESFGWRTAAWNAVPTAGKILDSILPLLFE